MSPVESEAGPEGRWRIRVDTGGTFTDCLAIDPEGRVHRAKVLSSSALRLRVAKVTAPGVVTCEVDPPWVEGFTVGARVRVLDGEAAGPEARVEASRGTELRWSPPLDVAVGATVELRFDLEAPILAARWVTRTPAAQPLPPLDLRLATTRGTNALLERRGARTALLVTRGFGDLLRIGDQRRADLFRLDIRKPEPLEERVEEVWERLAADGSVVTLLDPDRLATAIESLAAEGIESVAVALLHSYRQPRHERQVVEALERAGFRFVSASAELAPLAKILPRAQTAVVDAYLAPIIGRYLDAVESELGRAGRLQVMTSAGGLARRARFRAKDSLLSGPAGGVVGAAHCGRALGYERLVAFDMGGTSTDVSRIDGDFEYVFEHRVGGATVSAPALAIETVAAGGGSVCWLDGSQAKVGPQSAGADPGPACYGAGGPLSLTDVNLLLGRLAAERFRFPIHPAAATAACDRLLDALAHDDASPSRETLLEGFRAIADERMADAVRRISVRRGYDPRDYALLAFGGAGGQHACAVAELLGIRAVLIPRDAGLLSALGLGAAVVEQIAQEQVLEPLDGELGRSLGSRLGTLATRALAALEDDGVAAGVGEVRRRLAFLRLAGQESTLEVEIADPWLTESTADAPLDELLAEAFRDSYSEIYGYLPPDRPIEIESLRVVVSTPPPELDRASAEGRGTTPRPLRRQRTYCRPQRGAEAGWHDVAVHLASDLAAGDSLAGPALVLDEFATSFVEGGWSATLADNGTLVLERDR